MHTAPSRFALPLVVTFALTLGALSAGCAANADADPAATSQDSAITSAPLANFVEVRPGLYRGGHPDAEGLDYLKGLGVRRIVNLEVGDLIEAWPWDISKELSEAKARDIAELRYPMSAFESAVSDRFDANMDEIIAVLASATVDDPVYVHCKHGQDRTGLVIGLERVFDEGWDPAQAYDEMAARGFHTGFLGLDEYFERKTGWDDER